VIEAARAGGARIRDKDGLTLVLAPAEQIDRDAVIVELAMDLLRVEHALAVERGGRRPASYGGLAWLTALPDAAQQAFVTEAGDALLVAASGGPLQAVVQVIDDWVTNRRLGLVLDFLARYAPDVLMLQEIKCTNDQFPAKAFAEAGYPLPATEQGGACTITKPKNTAGIVARLEFYNTEELTRIVTRSASLLQILVDPEGAHEIARRSRGTPRIANRLLRRPYRTPWVHPEPGTV